MECWFRVLSQYANTRIHGRLVRKQNFKYFWFGLQGEMIRLV